MVPRDSAIISLFCTKQLGGNEKAPRRKKLYYESRHVGETQFSHREERLILVQGRRLVLQNILLKTKCETKASILIS